MGEGAITFFDEGSRGYALGILSNMPFDFIERYGKAIDLFGKADVAVFSCYESLIKPEPAIYRSIIEKLSLDPAEIAFFDECRLPNANSSRDSAVSRSFCW